MQRLSNMHTKNAEHKDNIYTLEEAFQKLDEAAEKGIDVEDLKEEATAIACALGTNQTWHIDHGTEKTNHYIYFATSEIIKAFVTYCVLKKIGTDGAITALILQERKKDAWKEEREATRKQHIKQMMILWCTLVCSLIAAIINIYKFWLR